MGKKIYITEEQEQMLVGHLVMETRFPINPTQVLIVKEFLDKNFQPCKLNEFGANGVPIATPIVQIKGPDGQPVKGLTARQLYDYLEPQFANMFSDKIHMSKFLVQVIKDWYYNRITKEGLLSVTHC